MFVRYIPLLQSLILAIPVQAATITLPENTVCRYRHEVQKHNKEVVTGQATTCIEEPPERVRRVEPGDLVRIGELRAHPEKPDPFWYQNTTCWWFTEPDVINRDLVMYQGIICEVKPTVWVVIDKFL